MISKVNFKKIIILLIICVVSITLLYYLIPISIKFIVVNNIKFNSNVNTPTDEPRYVPGVLQVTFHAGTTEQQVSEMLKDSGWQTENINWFVYDKSKDTSLTIKVAMVKKINKISFLNIQL